MADDSKGETPPPRHETLEQIYLKAAAQRMSVDPVEKCPFNNTLNINRLALQTESRRLKNGRGELN
jgi:hypothetical protein